MQRPKLLAFGVLIVSLAGYAFSRHRADTLADYTLDFATWQPTPDAIRTNVENAQPNPGETKALAQKRVFAELFKNRYRRQQDAIAIGFRFRDDKRIRLFTPARLEPWHTNRIVKSAWEETRALFGHPFEFEIFETYIAAAPVQIGEARALPDRPDTLRVTFFPLKQRRRP